MAATVGATAGCRPNLPSLIIHNRSAGAIVVRYREARGSEYCLGLNVPPRVAFRTSDGAHRVWTELDVSPDLTSRDSCVFSYSVPVRARSRMYFRSGIVCSDYERRGVPGQPAGEPIRPNFDFLVIESSSGTREWRGLDAARQFKRHRGNYCEFKVR